MLKNSFMGVIFTNHALQRLWERGITQSDAWYSFQHPDGSTAGSTSGSIKYYKDYGNQRIEVVATRNEKKEWIILSVWSKIMGNNQSVFPEPESFGITLLKFFKRKFLTHR